jgi:hypothetical protein
MRREKPHCIYYAYKSGFGRTIYNGDDEKEARLKFEDGKKKQSVTRITWFKKGLPYLWYRPLR